MSQLQSAPAHSWSPPPLRLPDERMRVLLDARKLGHGGIGTYIENLIAGFLELGIELTVIGSRRELLRFGLVDLVSIIDDETPQYSLRESFGLLRRINQRAFDVYHAPHFTLPFGLKIPAVVTVHDLIHLRHPEHFYYPWIAKPLIRSALRRASKVITVSEASRADLLDLMHDEAGFSEKVRVIPNAVDPRFVPPAQRRTENPYLLAILSNHKPHKGLSELLDAWIAFKRSASPEQRALRLLLVGEGSRAAGEVPPDVTPLGAVSKEKLVSLYQQARALIVPSRIEGFCLPVLEAHAAGTPVIATPAPAIKELLCRRDVCCAGFDAEALAAGIAEFCGRDGRNGAGLDPEGDCHLSRYTRAETARRVLDVYRNSLEQEER